MKKIVACVLFFITTALCSDIYKTFAICTIVNDLEYCAVSKNVNITMDNMTLENNGVKYSYVADSATLVMYSNDEFTNVSMVGVNEYINGVKNFIPYVSFKSNKNFVLIDAVTGCYIKKYYTGSELEFSSVYRYIDMNITDVSELTKVCIKQSKRSR